MRPNIVIVMTDQQRADQCGREGFPLDTTPFLDSLVMLPVKGKYKMKRDRRNYWSSCRQ